MPQGFLHGGENLGILPGLRVDDAVRVEADGGERRREQVPPPQAPQDRAAQPREAAADEQGRGRRVLGTRTALCEFVQAPERQSAPREVIVDRRDPERMRRPLRPRGAVEGHDPAAQIGQNGVVPGMGHALLKGIVRRCCSYFVLVPSPSQSVAGRGNVSIEFETFGRAILRERAVPVR